VSITGCWLHTQQEQEEINTLEKPKETPSPAVSFQLLLLTKLNSVPAGQKEQFPGSSYSSTKQGKEGYISVS
jgi:hypothetical protein